MRSLDATFDELRQRLQSPDALNQAKSELRVQFGRK